jgi:hypothetical protein
MRAWYNHTNLRGTNNMFVKLRWLVLPRTTLTVAPCDKALNLNFAAATVGYHTRIQPETYRLRFTLAISETRFLACLREATMIHQKQMWRFQRLLTCDSQFPVFNSEQTSLWNVSVLDMQSGGTSSNLRWPTHHPDWETSCFPQSFQCNVIFNKPPQLPPSNSGILSRYFPVSFDSL